MGNDAVSTDLVTCSCNICNEHIQFERGQAGAVVSCPHCGMETTLYARAGASSPIKRVAPPASGSDEVFLSEGGIVVSKTRFVAGVQTFALANITSVTPVQLPPRRGKWAVLLIVGLLVALFGISLINDDESKAGGAFVITFGGAMFLGAIFGIFTARPSYAVFLNTAGGEMKTCHSRDGTFVQRVVAALNQAIVARG